ncbi:MAG: hypothetical protein SW833_16485 [Cyanobacteriota bacterium]|nr:hypothetical protein [Cyanobacteriota bacterium]
MNSKNWEFLKPIVQPDKANVFLQRFEKIAFRAKNKERFCLSKQNGWVAVPVESADHFSESEEERLLSVTQKNGYEKLIAILFEDLKNFPPVSTIPTTAEGIAELNWEFSHFWLALFAGEPDWVIIGTKSNYFIVAGSPDFVRDFLGCEINDAFSEFYEFLLDYLDSSDPLGEYLLSVYNDLRTIYPQLESGSILCVGESNVVAIPNSSPASIPI